MPLIKFFLPLRERESSRSIKLTTTIPDLPSLPNLTYYLNLLILARFLTVRHRVSNKLSCLCKSLLELTNNSLSSIIMDQQPLFHSVFVFLFLSLSGVTSCHKKMLKLKTATPPPPSKRSNKQKQKHHVVMSR